MVPSLIFLGFGLRVTVVPSLLAEVGFGVMSYSGA